MTIPSALYSGKSSTGNSLPDPDGKPANMSKPVKVFILMGQSNMLGFGHIAGGEGSLENAVKNKKKYPYLIDDDGKWTVRKDVRNVRVMNFKDQQNEWMTVSGKNIGPELGIGHYIGETLDEPVLILKSCIGNRSLGWDLLPPGSKPFEQGGKTYPGYRGTPDNPKGNGEKVDAWYAGKQYDDDTESAKKVLENLDKYYPGAKKYEVAGFCFWQGAKDGGSAVHADQYEKNLVQFIKALRKDFNAPKAPFVIATMGHGKKGSGGTAGKITDAQLAVDGKKGKYKDFKGNVSTFYSNTVSMGGSANGHYSGHAETYMNVGEGMGKAMAALLGSSGGSSRRSGSTGDSYSGFPADEYKLCKKEADLLKKKRTFSVVLKSLEKSIKAEDEKSGEAKLFSEGLTQWISEQNANYLEQAKSKPAQTLMNIKDHVKQMKGHAEEVIIKKCEKDLKSIKSINSLISLYKKQTSVNAYIQKKGASKSTERSMKKLVDSVKKLILKKGLNESLKVEAETLLTGLEG